MTDLWPEIPDMGKTKTPREILDEQGTVLASKTRGKIEGVVEKLDEDDLKFMYNLKSIDVKPEFIYRFYLYSSALSYRTPLFTIFHQILLYPLIIIWESAPPVNKEGGGSSVRVVKIEDEDDFKNALRIIFSDEKTVSLLSAILRQT